MKIQARIKMPNGELGRKFWIMGTAEEPRVGLIYDQEKDATDFTRDEVSYLIDNFSNVVEFEKV